MFGDFMNKFEVIIKNTVYDFIYYIIVFVIGMLAPRYIILEYGSEINGLTSSINNLVNMLLLLQSGVVSASTQALYKHVAEKSVYKVSQTISYSSRYLQKIGFKFLSLMILVSTITPLIIKSNLRNTEIIIAFFAIGLKGFIDIYYVSKYRILFTAYQEKYVLSISTLIEQIVYYSLLFTTIYMHNNYLYIYLWIVISCIIKTSIMSILKGVMHNDISFKGRTCEGFSYIKRNSNYSMINEISHSIINSMMVILISTMYGLEEASVYSVFFMITHASYLILSAFFSSFESTFGNIVALKNKRDTLHSFRIFQSLFLSISTIFIMVLSFLTIPFVKIYTNNINDVNYINLKLTFLVIVSSLFSYYRIPYNIIVSTFGFFKETYMQPVVTAVICLILSLLLGLYDYSFVIIGLVIFYLMNFVYQYHVIKKHIPWIITRGVFRSLVITIIGFLISFCSNFFIIPRLGIIEFCIYAMLCTFFSVTYVICINKLFNKETFCVLRLYKSSVLKF